MSQLLQSYDFNVWQICQGIRSRPWWEVKILSLYPRAVHPKRMSLQSPYGREGTYLSPRNNTAQIHGSCLCTRFTLAYHITRLLGRKVFLEGQKLDQVVRTVRACKNSWLISMSELCHVLKTNLRIFSFNL